MAIGLKHIDIGTQLTKTEWEATNTHEYELSNVVWLDASTREISDLNRTATLAFTELDLTANTSANAKFALLQVTLAIDSITAGSGNSVSVEFRKNGTTPTYYIGTKNDGVDMAAASVRKGSTLIVGLDTGQIVEYHIVIAGTIQVDTYIDLMGYIE